MILPYTLKRLLNHKTSRSDVTAGYTVLTAEELREPADRICQRLLECAGVKSTDKDNAIDDLTRKFASLSKSQRLELMSALLA